MSFNDEVKKIEKEMVKDFCDRKTSVLIRKSPEEIINMWLDWKYSRFHVKEESEVFFIVDLLREDIVVVVSKELIGAKQFAYDFCNIMNQSHENDEDVYSFDEHDYIIHGDLISLINSLIDENKDDIDKTDALSNFMQRWFNPPSDDMDE